MPAGAVLVLTNPSYKFIVGAESGLVRLRIIATLNSSIKGPFTRAIFVAIFLILTHAIEWLSHKSVDLYSFAQMV